jgi:hypothetical protein
MMRRPWQPSDGDTICQECSSLNPCWWVEDDVWHQVVGSSAGILCPNCFIVMAESKGFGRSGAWQLYAPGVLR